LTPFCLDVQASMFGKLSWKASRKFDKSFKDGVMDCRWDEHTSRLES